MPRRYGDADELAAHIADRLDNQVRLALPLGLGKSAAIANALYRRARRDPELTLDIFTALSLEIPNPRHGLEARLLAPIVERLYEDVPTLEYAADFRRGRLPENVQVQEFYFRPGAYLGVESAQQSYTSINYSYVARELARRGVNVICQLVAPDPFSGTRRRFSLSCNPDLTLDLIDEAVAAGQERPLLIAEVCEALPFLGGDAVVGVGALDALLEPVRQAALFPVPNRAVTLAEHAIAIRATALIEDGGTLQIGIGSLGDAIAYAIATRHRHNGLFRRLAGSLGVETVEAGLAPFEEGLYGMSEMLTEGLLYLRRAGVLSRTVSDGVYLHAGFFLGSAGFYDALRSLAPGDAEGLKMCRISFVNRLLGNEDQKRRQRRRARFLNTAMKVTLDGAAVSDTLEDGRVVSGVGGQFDFVTMGHALDDARSIIMLPATHGAGRRLVSNIVWRHGEITVPRHMRDVVVTEYGVADLRGLSDAEVAARLIDIADSRFQGELRAEAIAAGKLPRDHRISGQRGRNLPETLEAGLTRAGLQSALPFFPIGTDLTERESALEVALKALEATRADRWAMAKLAISGWYRRGDPRITGPLERLGLSSPRTIREHAERALVGAMLLDRVISSERPLFGPE